VLTVVKIGGGVGADALPALCETVGDLARRHPLLVVPGGAGFADAVREADRRFGLRDGTAHRMAILGMEQFGWLLSDLIPGAVRTTELRAVPGRAAVLLPAALPLDGLPESWAVTSDSIAAWVAGRMGAERLVLVKHPSADANAVDAYLPVLLEHAQFETCVVGPDQLSALPWKNG
jgi:5-(aminomethyl)-3-furanmethanol phosphate kinase